MAMIKKPPHQIDILMGARVRNLRTLRGISQEKLGKALGLTFQQVQKYEKGYNRMGSSRLFQISQVFGITFSELVKDIEVDAEKPVNKNTHAPTRLELKSAGDYAKLSRENQVSVNRIVKTLIGTQ